MAGNESLKPRVVVERRVVGRFGRIKSSVVVPPEHEEVLIGREGVGFNVKVLPDGVGFNSGFMNGSIVGKFPDAEVVKQLVPTREYLLADKVKGEDIQGNTVAYVSRELPHSSSR